MYSQERATAQEAFARGDEVLQLAIPLDQQSGQVGPDGGYTSSQNWEVSSELNQVVNQGWSLLSAAVVFVPTSQVSRDKFVTSGQQLAVSGQVVGYYVFTRDETKKRTNVESTPARQPSRPSSRSSRPSSEVSALPPLPD
jgi:hypothetical protein